jgi:hypothetical protein
VFYVWSHSYEVVGPGKATLEAVLDGLAGKTDTWVPEGIATVAYKGKRLTLNHCLVDLE